MSIARCFRQVPLGSHVKVWQAPDRNVLLYGHRDAMERAQLVAIPYRLLGRFGLQTGRFGVDHLEGVELGLELLGATEEVFGNLDWRYLAFADQLPHLVGGHPGQLRRHATPRLDDPALDLDTRVVGPLVRSLP